jgi:hypothetical protein
MIPAAKPSKISVKIALKADAPSTPTVIFGSGRIFFPNGFDINQIGWKINVNSADESTVTVPEIKDELIDTAALTANTAISNQSTQTTANQSLDQNAMDKTENPTEMAKTEQTPVAANTQNLSSAQVESDKTSGNTIIIAVLAITGLAVLLGAGLFYISRQSKEKKAVK